MSKQKILCDLVEAASENPIFVDIGSSGYAQAVFAPIAPASTIVGFDADARGQDMKFAKGFKGSHLVPKAVVADDSANDVDFYLTQYPACSSTLPADLESLKDYIFHDYFLPQKTVKIPATSLNRVQKDLNLPRFDWIKVDSQGTDLRILKSISKELFNQLLVIEIEPGVVDAYQTEDLFVETHQYLVSQGFWLCDLHMQSYPHVSPQGFKELEDKTKITDLNMILKSSPTAAEARYMRKNVFFEVQSDEKLFKRALILALTDDQMGYAFDLLKIYSKKFGENEFFQKVQCAIFDLIELRRKSLRGAADARFVASPIGMIYKKLKNDGPKETIRAIKRRLSF